MTNPQFTGHYEWRAVAQDGIGTPERGNWGGLEACTEAIEEFCKADPAYDRIYVEQRWVSDPATMAVMAFESVKDRILRDCGDD
jgi:hypothetical protein